MPDTNHYLSTTNTDESKPINMITKDKNSSEHYHIKLATA